MRLDRIAIAGGLVLVGAAVATELAKPARERHWHGELLGVVPYDLRLPTISRARDRWWNPADERLFTPHVFRVGWSINLARLASCAGVSAPVQY